MSFDITEAIKSVGEAFKSLFDYADTAKTRQSETQLVKDKKRLKKATNIAQEIFRITDEFKHQFPEDVLKEYEKLRKQFDEQD